MPSGAWADTVSRRGLLVLSSALYAVGFSLWLLLPSFTGFVAGFVLWGISGALMSGTFEALVYDELSALDATEHFAAIIGWANSAAMVALLAALAAAAPLMALGGYALVGWISVGVAALQGVLAVALPKGRPVAAAAGDEAPEPRRYAAMLGAGLLEVRRSGPVRSIVGLSAVLLGVLAFDEYLPLVAAEQGVATAQVPLLVALVGLGDAVGTALAGRTVRLGSGTLAWGLALAAGLVAAGAARGHPAGFLAVAVGYGIACNVIVVAEARLQDAIRGPARATVTSASGLLGEVYALVLFGAFAAGSTRLALGTMVALLSLPLLGLAVAVPRWLPRPALPRGRGDPRPDR